MGIEQVSGSGSTIPSNTPGSEGANFNAGLDTEIADLLRGLNTLASSFDPDVVNSSSNSVQSGPVLKASSVPLNFLITTLSVMRANLTEAIQDSIFGDLGILKTMFEQYLKFGKPGDLTAAIIAGTASTNTPEEIQDFLDRLSAGTATPSQADIDNMFNQFKQWLQTLDTRDRSIVADSLIMILRLLPDTITPSTSQDFSDSSAAGGLSLPLKASTQTQTGPDYLRELIRSLFDELIQRDILNAIVIAHKEVLQTSLSGADKELKDANTYADRVVDALKVLISHASALSNKAMFSLLRDANGATINNESIVDTAKATAVLATLVRLLQPDSVENALDEIASLIGIDVSKLTPDEATQVSTAVARFLQDALVGSGLIALFQGLRGVYAQKQTPEDAQRQIDLLKQRVFGLNGVLNGDLITEDTLSDTLGQFQSFIQARPERQVALSEALPTILEGSLKTLGVTGDRGLLAASVGDSVVRLFAENREINAINIQEAIQEALAAQDRVLTQPQQNILVADVLKIASSVITQQEVQTSLIRAGAALAAPRFAAQLNQVLYGFSIDGLDGKVTYAHEEGTPLSVVSSISPSGVAAQGTDMNVELGAFLLHLMDPASVVLQLANPIMYAGQPSDIPGDRNIGSNTIGP